MTTYSIPYEKNMKNKPYSLAINIVLYVIGAMLGFTLVLLATWADVEAQFYGFYRRSNTPLPGLDCPIFMTSSEVNKVSLRITNTTDKPLNPNIRTEISTSALPFLSIESIKIAPAESKTMEWRIGPENIDLKHFVFVEVLVYSFYPLPTSEGICGIFFVNLPINGSTIVAVMTLLSLLGMGVGLYGLNRVPSPTRRVATIKYPLLFLSFLIAAAILASLLEWWLQGLVLLVLILLLTLVLILAILGLLNKE